MLWFRKMTIACIWRKLKWSQIPNILLNEMPLIELIRRNLLLIVLLQLFDVQDKIFIIEYPMQALRKKSALLLAFLPKYCGLTMRRNILFLKFVITFNDIFGLQLKDQSN